MVQDFWDSLYNIPDYKFSKLYWLQFENIFKYIFIAVIISAENSTPPDSKTSELHALRPKPPKPNGDFEHDNFQHIKMLENVIKLN